MTTEGDDAGGPGPPSERELALLDALASWADTLDELADMFRATAGERSAGLAYVYGDCARTVRRLARTYRAQVGL